MAISFVGASAFTSGVGALSVLWPAGTKTGDVAFLAVESANQAYSGPGGQWAAVPNSPQFTGTAGVAGGVRLSLFYQVLDVDYLNSVAVTDTGDHTTARIFVYRGARIAGAIGNTAGSVLATGNTAATFPGVTTTGPGSRVIHFIAVDTDANSTATMGVATNANLSDITERGDNSTSSGSGGGIVVIDGLKATAGATGNTTATGSTAITRAYITVELLQGGAQLQAQITNPTITVGAEGPAFAAAFVGAYPAASSTAVVAFQSGTTTGWRSTDGTTFSSVTLPSASSWRSSAASTSRFVLLADGTSTPTTGYAYSTNDGVNWTAGTLPSSQFWNAVAWGNGIFMVTGGTLCATSADGITWTTPTTTPEVSTHLAWTGTAWLMRGGTTLYKSTNNGTSWAAVSGAPTIDSAGFAINGSGVSAYGTGTTSIVSSRDDFTTRQTVNLAGTGFGSNNYFKDSAGGGIFCIAEFGGFYFSNDAVTWLELDTYRHLNTNIVAWKYFPAVGGIVVFYLASATTCLTRVVTVTDSEAAPVVTALATLTNLASAVSDRIIRRLRAFPYSILNH